jgi:hypothetical protein
LAPLFLNGQHLQTTLQARYLVPQTRIGGVLGGPLSVLCQFDLDHQHLALRLGIVTPIARLVEALWHGSTLPLQFAFGT